MTSLRAERGTEPLQTIANRLEEAGSLLEEHVNAIAAFIPQLQGVPYHFTASSQHDSPGQMTVATPADTTRGSLPLNNAVPSNSSASGDSCSPSFLSSEDLPVLTIPVRHSTTTGSLLTHHAAQALLGSFPADMFYRIEARRSLPSPLSIQLVCAEKLVFPAIDHHYTNVLVEEYFSYVHPQHPLVELEAFMSLYHLMLREGPRDTLESALCFVVLALGQAASESPDFQNLSPDWCPGTEYFSCALQIFLRHFHSSFGTSLLLPQGLYLCAVYYGFLARPLQSWKLVHMASTNLQHLWIQSVSPPGMDRWEYG